MSGRNNEMCDNLFENLSNSDFPKCKGAYKGIAQIAYEITEAKYNRAIGERLIKVLFNINTLHMLVETCVPYITYRYNDKQEVKTLFCGIPIGVDNEVQNMSYALVIEKSFMA